MRLLLAALAVPVLVAACDSSTPRYYSDAGDANRQTWFDKWECKHSHYVPSGSSPTRIYRCNGPMVEYKWYDLPYKEAAQ